MAAASSEVALTFIELGLVVLGLAVLARLASRIGFSAIPLYLIAGLAFGNGGVMPLRFGNDFVRVGAEVGVLLLLFMLGLEYTGDRLIKTLRTGYSAGLIDLLLNFTPGFLAGLFLGMSWMIAILMGGITLITSSGIVAKIIAELKRKDNPETNVIVTILVLEDLAMAVYLPVVAVLLSGQALVAGAISVTLTLTIFGVIAYCAIRFGPKLSNFVEHQSDEILLLSTLGIVLLASGVAQQLQISAAIGAFLVGVGVSGPIVKRAERLLSPLRDLFAAIFFLFFGLQIDPSSLPPALGIAAILATVTTGTKLLTGWLAGRRAGLTQRESLRAGATLVPRGEFSIVIAGLALAAEPRIGPIAAAYVLMTAVLGPILARLTGDRQAPLPAKS